MSLSDLMSQFRAAMQFSGKMEATIHALATRVGSVEANAQETAREVKSHGERIARLEAAGETLEERTMLHLERAILRATRGDDPRLAP